MNILKINACYIYIALWIMYYLQQMLMIRGVIAQTILVVLLMMSFYAFIQVNRNYRIGPYIKWLNVMLVVISIYGIIPIIGEWAMIGNVGVSWRTYLYLQNIYMSLFPIYAFYYYAVTKRMASSNLTLLYSFLLLFSIMMFYQNYYSESEVRGRDEITNNVGFFFVPLIPMLQLLKIKDIWKYINLIVIFCYLLMAMKRGAILAGSVMALLFMIHHFRNVSWKRMIYIICMSAIVLIALYYFTINLYVDSEYFQSRIEQTLSGNSSGRDAIYYHYFKYYLERTSGLEFLIGNGVNATYVLFGNWAHNDWLEFAIDMGALGVVMYLVYWITFIWEWNNFRGSKECKYVIGDLIIAYFLIAFYSMSIDDMPFAATLCIAYCLVNSMKFNYSSFYAHR